MERATHHTESPVEPHAELNTQEAIREWLESAPLGVQIGYERYCEHNEVFFFTTDRYRSQYLLGPSGSGKTTLIVHQAVQDINNATPIMVFDSGNAIDQIVARIDKEKLTNVVLVDFSNPACKINLNFLYLDAVDANNKTKKSRLCEDAIEVLRGNVPFSWSGSRFEQKVRAAVMTILDENFPYPRSLLAVSLLIFDKHFREKALRPIKTPYVRSAWQLDDDASKSLDHGEVNQWTYAKFDIFDTNATLKQAFGPGKPTLSIEDLMAKGKSLLVKIDESVIGSKVADMLRSFFVLQLKHAIFRRSLIPKDERIPYFLYFDEFQRFACESFAELLSEARKYSVGLVLAHQNLRQLVPFSRQTESFNSELLESVLANTGTLVAFRPSAKDAEVLSLEFDVPAVKLRAVPPYCATVRMLSDGRALEPTVVAIPKPARTTSEENLTLLKEHMKASGVWLTQKSNEKEARLQQTTPRPYDEELDTVLDEQPQSKWSQLSRALKETREDTAQVDLLELMDELIKKKKEE